MAKQCWIHVQNIYSQAKEEDVKQLLECFGPLVSFKAKKEDPKFSVEAEYYDPINAEVACEQLSGYKFQNRDLKVRLSGNPQPSRIHPYQIEKVNYKTSNTYDIQSITEQSIDTRKSFYENLTNSQKIAILEEIKLVYGNKPQLLAELLKQNQKMAKLILTIQQDVMSRQEVIYHNFFQIIRKEEDDIIFLIHKKKYTLKLEQDHKPNDLPYQQYICFLLLLFENFFHQPSLQSKHILFLFYYFFDQQRIG